MSLPEKRSLTFHEVKAQAQVRLSNAGYGLREETNGDGNCFIYAILNQMKYVYIYQFICLLDVSFLHFIIFSPIC